MKVVLVPYVKGVITYKVLGLAVCGRLREYGHKKLPGNANNKTWIGSVHTVGDVVLYCKS